MVTKRSQVYRIWLMLNEPRSVTFIMMFVYGFHIALGISGLHTPQFPWEEAINEFTRIVVNILLIVGGVVGLLSTPRGFWQFERAGIVMLSVGLFIHLLWTAFDPAPGVRWAQGFRITLLILWLVKRYINTMHAKMDPQK